MAARRSAHKKVWWIGSVVGVACAIAVVVAGGVVWRRGKEPAHTAASRAAIPVTVAAAAQRDVPIYMSGPGTVSAWTTVSVHSLVEGTLQSVNFNQGQEIHRGDTLAVIDQRPFQATLDQAQAKKAQDQSQLTDDQRDLDRFKTLAAKAYQSQQSVDLQQSKVDTDRALIEADQAAIEAAQTQLSYTTITSPIDGITGFRQLDAGNIIHPTDATPLTVVTQIQPVQVTFTLPQRNLADVREAMLAGPVSVIAYDQDDTNQLAAGELMLINNQINETTSTISIRAKFDNRDRKLWPGEFVRAHILVSTHKDAVIIPPVAVQRDVNGLYAWVVDSDDRVERRPIETTPVDPETTIVTKGLKTGEKVVVNGQYGLEPGTRVEAGARTADAAASAVGAGAS